MPNHSQSRPPKLRRVGRDKLAEIHREIDSAMVAADAALSRFHGWASKRPDDMAAIADALEAADDAYRAARRLYRILVRLAIDTGARP